MFPKNEVSFKETLRRLIGVYVIIYFINKPNDEIGGVIKSIDDDGKVVFGLDDEFNTHITFIDHIVIPNEDKAEESPLSKALKKAQNK